MFDFLAWLIPASFFVMGVSAALSIFLDGTR